MFKTQYDCPPDTGLRGRKIYVELHDSPSAFAAESAKRASRSDKARLNSDSDFYDGKSFIEAVKLASTGDLSRVPESDRLLSEYEALSFQSSRRAWTDDVVGALPNVPAYVAGLPMCMRRRSPQPSESAPVAILVDLTCSTFFTSDMIARRGAAILALVRCLSSRRNVELWAGTIVGADGDFNGVALFSRVETSPLDLATAGYVLQSGAYLRRLHYALSRTYGFEGGWAFDSHTASREHLAALMRPAMPHIAESVIVPAMHESDIISTDPQAWIKHKLIELGVVTMDDAA